MNLDATVQRVAPENLRQRLSPGLTEVPRIAGRPTVPVLSLHGLGDLFVPLRMEQAYARHVARHGRSRLPVQRSGRPGRRHRHPPALPALLSLPQSSVREYQPPR